MVKSKSKANRKPKTNSDAEIVAAMEYVDTAHFLLNNYGRYGLAERVCYHFDLIEALGTSKTKSNQSTGDHVLSSAFSGVTGLLDFSPVGTSNKMQKRQRRAIRNQTQKFNEDAKRLRNTSDTCCYQPRQLPLRVHPTSRVYFAYEVTRIAFCLDASPSLTNTCGVSGGSKVDCCPLDRLPQMAKTFFTALVKEVESTLITDGGHWTPEVAVSVIAVYPLGKKVETDLLVRDFRVKDLQSAEMLVKKIDHWIHHEVEYGISERMCRENPASTFCVPMYSSSMRDILDTGDYALSVLSSEARPLIVVATDCRSVSCEGIVDVYLDIDRVDVPVIVLDLSSPETHAMAGKKASMKKKELNFLTYDPANPSAFPLHLSDDSEALFGICRATGGAFLDSNILQDASERIVGVDTEFGSIAPNASRPKYSKMNRVQWLTLFSLSPLSPTYASGARLPPPPYLQKHLTLNQADEIVAQEIQPTNAGITRHETLAGHPFKLGDQKQPTSKRTYANSRTTFSTYVVYPIRIKALLLVRIKEGYRAKQYGSSTADANKVVIQFKLPLQLGTVLHYELSYTASSSKNPIVGSAHIKIVVSGNTKFIQSVKNDFLRHGTVQETRPFTTAQRASARLCQVIRRIRLEDLKASSLCPPLQWSSQLGSMDSPFVKRLGALTEEQRRRHFQRDEFDVLFTGRMPYAVSDDFFSDFIATDNGEQELFDHLAQWSTQIVSPRTHYVKQLFKNKSTYCVVGLKPSMIASRIYSLTIEYYGGIDPNDRLETLESLKTSIDDLKDVMVLRKQLGPYLAGITNTRFWYLGKIEIEFHHARWELVIDPELLPLLMKRRLEIGQFLLLHSTPTRAMFGKLAEQEAITGAAGDLVQYQIAIMTDRVVVDLHMESESAIFTPFRPSQSKANRFDSMVQRIRQRDQQCGRALRSRTNLLMALQSPGLERQEDVSMRESHRESAKRIMAYSSAVSSKLRFFHHSMYFSNDLLCKMVSDFLLSKPLGLRVQKLDIGTDELMIDEGRGLWYVVQFDRETMSLLHLSLDDKVEETEDGVQTFRTLTFFTSSISALYSKRDDMGDDDSIDSHISEYLCVTDFADHIEAPISKVFSSAGYLSMRSKDHQSIDFFQPVDLGKVMEPCEFVDVASVVTAAASNYSFDDEASVVTTKASNQKEDDGLREYDRSKLYQMISSILSPIPGNEECMFYCGEGQVEDDQDLRSHDSESQSAASVGSLDLHDSSNSVNNGEDEFDETEVPNLDDGSIGVTNGNNDSVAFEKSLLAPIFVRFLLDGENASLEDLHQIPKNTRLTAQMSIFKGELSKQGNSQNAGLRLLPRSHHGAALEISSLLKSYVAEQTLENLREQGALISLEGLQMVKKCLERIQTVASSSIDIFFYVSKTDQMVQASAPAGRELEVEEGFVLLDAELRKSEEFSFRPLVGGGFVVVGSSGFIDFWSFVQVGKEDGILIQTYHPGGSKRANEMMTKIHGFIGGCIHRVNQTLLLERLHRSRTASVLMIPNDQDSDSISNLIIPNDQDSDSISNASSNLVEEEIFLSGCFECPVVFKSDFELYTRCAASPFQVAQRLEGDVLHSFAVSNRRSLFVYKDESDAIFYMRLKAEEAIDDNGSVTLLVYGVNPPGPSVTRQLRTLLQRRILLIGVDMLASILTKNPHFLWMRTDLKFLNSFEEDWASLEKEVPVVSDQSYIYEFPAGANDPCMVLLMFRQNICGSSFFHRLNDFGLSSTGHVSISSVMDEGGAVLSWNSHGFTLYYNNAPSKLDPSFQGVSTLTGKGEMLCREAGAGIAMVEVSLVRADGTPVDETVFAVPVNRNGNAATTEPVESLRFCKLEAKRTDEEAGNICVQIRITGSTIRKEYLHQLVALTLDQALLGWYLEQLLEKTVQLNVRESLLSSKAWNGDTRETQMPELTRLTDILECWHTLPHPAIKKVECQGVIRASSVATTTLEVLEKAVLPLLTIDMSPPFGNQVSSLRILRLSRSGAPRMVNLAWDNSRREAVVLESTDSPGKDVIKDSPIDCPEYKCFFWLTEEERKKMDRSLQVYEGIMIHDGISERNPTIETLEEVKGRFPGSFQRSLAFVLSIKRNRRSFWAYNFNPHVLANLSERLNELEMKFLRDVGDSVGLLQKRCLHLLAPSLGFNRPRAMSIRRQEAETAQLTHRERSNNSGSAAKMDRPPRSKRTRRQVSLMRPKLIGKSVEGAAVHAVAASRKRASSNHQFKNVAGKRPPVPRLTRQTSKNGDVGSSTKTEVDAQTTKSHRKDQTQMSEELVRVSQDYSMICMVKNFQIQRLSTLQSKALIKLATVWWPIKNKETIPKDVGQFLFRKAAFAWSDSRPFPPIPNGTGKFFIPLFARYLAALNPGLQIVPIRLNGSVSKEYDSILLSSEVKNVRGCKAFVAVLLSRVTIDGKDIIRSEGAVINLPRRSREAQLKKGGGTLRSSMFIEKDSAGMAKLGHELHQRLCLDRNLFDFNASMMERTVRLQETTFELKDIVPTMRRMMSKFSLERQKRIPKLNYRVFEAAVILKNYNDKFISKFNGEELFQRLYAEAEDMDMIRCEQGLCFKKGISVRGSHCVCFLTSNETELSKMQLVLLCRTQGRDLADFMFREGSNVAIRILDNIVLESSGMAFKALRTAARDLLKDSLWRLLSSPTQLQEPAPISMQAEIQELLALTHARRLREVQDRLLGHRKNSNSSKFKSSLMNPSVLLDVNWDSLCDAMHHDPAFAPHWVLDDDSLMSSHWSQSGLLSPIQSSLKITSHLFYLSSADLFLLFGINHLKRTIEMVSLVEKDDSVAPERRQIAIQQLYNFLLHFMWQSL
ncbi:unnamed protein product [Cylindrotheca closterium]|uniref:Uncharacterized protein n=1 Tax=Cylindrotheca closterium TaxID=2856 RepID=A0AAD2FW42_9STRA|nr:unnamed protein product [Cylindrotheca closterium]